MAYRILFTVIVFLATANLLVWSFLGVEHAYAERVYPGVWVDAQPLVGLTREQIIDRLKPLHAALLNEKVTLELAGKTYEPTLSELGYTVDTTSMAEAALKIGRGSSFKQSITSYAAYYQEKTVPLLYTVEQGKFDSYLNEIGKTVTKEPKDLALNYQDGNLITTPAEAGITLDKEQLRQAIQQEVRPGKTARITLSFGTTQPRLNSEGQIAQAKTQLTKLLAKPLVLQAEEVTVSLEPKIIYDFVYYTVTDDQLVVNFNEDKIRSEITKVAKKVDILPKPKHLSSVNNSVIQEGNDGRQLDVPDTARRVLERLKQGDFESPLVLKIDKLERKTVTITPEYQLGRYSGKYIEVDLSAQRMHLLEGESYHKTLIISTGKWDMPTPMGEHTIHNHIRTAFSKRYGLYMDFWMAITSNGEYGIHQLPRWPNGRVEGISHLGRPVSHGCIRLGPGDAEYVYNWVENGTKVFIHE